MSGKHVHGMLQSSQSCLVNSRNSTDHSHMLLHELAELNVQLSRRDVVEHIVIETCINLVLCSQESLQESLHLLAKFQELYGTGKPNTRRGMKCHIVLEEQMSTAERRHGRKGGGIRRNVGSTTLAIGVSSSSIFYKAS